MIHPLSLVEKHTESWERDESPNGGRLYTPEFRKHPALIPSSSLRHVLRSADNKDQAWKKLGEWLGMIGL